LEEEQTPNELEEDLSVSTPDELSKPKLKKKPKKASLVINVYSWATPLVGLIMLIAGLLLGYIGRPLLEREPEATPIAAVPTQATVGNSASSEELMTFLTSQARHFKGNPDAPVTLIEFSDFQ
jgi:hypothetical protein